MKKFLVGIVLAAPIGLACGPLPPPGTGGTAGQGGQGGQGGNPGNAFCAVKAVLEAKCTGCHYPNSAQAPMSLQTFADTQAIRNGRPVWQIMRDRIAAGTMPPFGSGISLSQEQKNTITGWNGSGSNDCGGGGTACAPGQFCSMRNCTGEGCINTKCNITHRFVAHAGGKQGRFPVPAGTKDDYRCFTFTNPFYSTNPDPKVDIQVTAETPLINSGNPGVLHHWLLFGSTNPPGGDGSIMGGPGIFNCIQPELTDKLLSGWAPGGDAYILPDDIGLSLKKYPFLVLQNHYNNETLAAGSDASGVAYCTSPAARQNTATIVTLGTDNISIPAGASNAAASGRCDTSVGGNGLAKSNRPVYIFASSPHMHKLGTKFRTTHTRGGQALPDISNIGTWVFDKQHKFGLPRVEYRPGDSMVTTCNYANPTPFGVNFGPGTIQEMCYDFVMAYPLADVRGECGQGVTFTGGN
ncbi:MAG TPA: hypothetical protein VK524_32255 [Polyangiaceae bacterium]|nr:hypothetical protein [Polyangiaceae bacterium]